VRRLGRQPGLADARLARDEHHGAGAAGGVRPGVEQRAHLGLAAHERRVGAGGPLLAAAGGRRRDRRGPAEQLEVRGLGLGRRVDAQLVGERAPQPLVGPQRLGPVAGRDVGGHAAPVGALAQRRPPDRLVRERQRVGVVAEARRGEAGGLEAGQQRVGEVLADAGHPLAVVVGQQRLLQVGDRRDREVAGGGEPAGAEGLLGGRGGGLGALDVDDRVVGQVQHVAAGLGDQRRRPARHRRRHERADPADDAAQRGRPRVGQAAGPQRVGELVAGGAALSIHRQAHERDLRPRAGELGAPRTVALDGHRTCQTDLDGHPHAPRSALPSPKVRSARGVLGRARRGFGGRTSGLNESLTPSSAGQPDRSASDGRVVGAIAPL
jgi:hypothetical protein